MPNCDFYATTQDHAQVLDWLFAEGTCKVFESYSQVEMQLKELHSTQEVLAEFDQVHADGAPTTTVHLKLFVVGAGPSFVPRRIQLNPKHCNGATFRYAADGFGLIQFYLSRTGPKGLENSHINHCTAARAGNCTASAPAPPFADEWDFKKITSFSTRLNRQIRNLGVAKIGSCPVLPGALDLWNEGVFLLPFRQQDNQLILDPS